MSSLILVEGIDIDFLHKCALEDCSEQHQFSTAPDIIKVRPDSLWKLGTPRIGMVEKNVYAVGLRRWIGCC